MLKRIVSYLKWPKKVCIVNENNLLDLRWQEYLANKDIQIYKELVSAYDEFPYNEKLFAIMSSNIFSEQVYKYVFLFQSFFKNMDIFDEFDQLNRAKTSNTYKSTIAKFVSDILNIRELIISECDNEHINELLLKEQFSLNTFKSLENILSFTSIEKVKILESNAISIFDDVDVLQSNGSNIFDACFIRFANTKRRIYIISLETPIDAFYFPASGLILKSTQCRFEIASRAKKLNHYFFSNYEKFIDEWNLPHKSTILSYLIRDKRPYHVIADELSGYFQTQELLSKKLNLCLLPRSSFFEYYELVKDSKKVLSDKLQESGKNIVFFSNYFRLQECETSEKYKQWLINSASSIYAKELKYLTENRAKKIWLGITGGEKRVWIEEKESLIEVINYFKNKYNNVHFVFDGYTNSYDDNQNTQKYIDQHIAILNYIIQETGLSDVDFTSVIGAHVLKKVAIGSLCSFHISTGTPSTWISKICKIPGIAHGNYGMLKNIKMVTDSKSIIVVPRDKIVEEGLNIEAQNVSNRWDFINYSIKSHDIIHLIEHSWCIDKSALIKSAQEAMNYEKYELALKLWETILKDSEKWDKDHVAGKLQCLYKLSRREEIEVFEETIKNQFKTYRNITHLLKSASFFGNPSVKIIKDVRDGYRIIDCNTNILSDVVFITFGTVSSRHDHIPFAHPFLINQGFKHIHVAQYKGTQYQNLSLEMFYNDLSEIIDKYSYRFTYGASLGGYAALYYAISINAKAIAASPRLPLHPLNKRWENVLWTKGSHYDEYDFRHLNLLKESIPSMNPTVILDSDDMIDSNFYNYYIAKVFSDCELIDVKGSGHASLRALLKDGTLKTFITDQVTKYKLKKEEK